MTYAALTCIKILGADLACINRSAIVAGMRQLQVTEGDAAADAWCVGAVRSCPHSPLECDLRFIYSAVAVSDMLGDWSGLDISAALKFIARCQTYEGGFALVPGGEAHGGSTYCAVAAMRLIREHMQQSSTNSSSAFEEYVDRQALRRWLTLRQHSCATRAGDCNPGTDATTAGSCADDGGMTGRAGKTGDACYGFWIVAATRLVEAEGSGVAELHDAAALARFLLSCQAPDTGGFGRDWESVADPFHTHYALAGISFCGTHSLAPLDAARAVGLLNGRSHDFCAAGGSHRLAASSAGLVG